MSWSITVIGVPTKVNEKLDEYSASLSGVSKQEFDEIKEHLQALVSANVVHGIFVKLSASGHANFVNGNKQYGNCAASLEQFYAQLAL